MPPLRILHLALLEQRVGVRLSPDTIDQVAPPNRVVLDGVYTAAVTPYRNDTPRHEARCIADTPELAVARACVLYARRPRRPRMLTALPYQSIARTDFPGARHVSTVPAGRTGYDETTRPRSSPRGIPLGYYRTTHFTL